MRIDMNHIGHIISIADSGLVDELDFSDIGRIQGKQFRFACRNAVDADLYLSTVVDGGNLVAGIVNADIGKIQFLKDCIPGMGSLLHLIYRIECPSVCLWNNACRLYLHFIQCHMGFLLLCGHGNMIKYEEGKCKTTHCPVARQGETGGSFLIGFLRRDPGVSVSDYLFHSSECWFGNKSILSGTGRRKQWMTFV